MNKNRELENVTNISKALYKKVEEVIPVSPLEIKEALRVTIERGKLLLEKQERISEIADIINTNYKEWFDTAGIIPEGSSHYAECLEAGAYYCAVALYDAGYRKEPLGKIENEIRDGSGCSILEPRSAREAALEWLNRNGK